MDKIIISVGTNSEKKIDYLCEVLKEIGINAEIIPNKVASDVSDQPISDEETLTGSINRAKKALQTNSHADCGLGIEVGYQKNKNEHYEIFCYATIVDKEKNKISCCSSKFLLPKFHREKVENNLNLCEYLDQFLKESNKSEENYFKDLIDTRKPFIIESVRNCILQYLMRKEF